MSRNSIHISLIQLQQTEAGKLAANQKLFAELKGKKGKGAAAANAIDTPEKQWMHDELQFYCNKNLLELHTEYRFAKPRRFKFDWAIINPVLKLKIAIEYEGIMSEKSGHTTAKGYTKDTDKYRVASDLGWHLMRFTVFNYKTVITELQNHLQRKDY